MFTNVLTDFSNFAKSSMGGVLGALRNLSNALNDEVARDSEHLSFVSGLYAWLQTNMCEEISNNFHDDAIGSFLQSFDDGDLDVLNDILDGNPITLNFHDQFLVINHEIEGNINWLTIAGQKVIGKIGGAFTELNDLFFENPAVTSVGGELVRISELFASAISGCSVKAKLQVLVNKASSANWGDSGVSELLRAIIQSLAFPVDIAVELYSYVSSGPRTLLQGIWNLYQGTKANYEDRQSSEYWNDISVSVSEFACGLVLQVVTSVLQGIALALSIVSRVAAIITTIVSAVVSLVSQIAKGIVEAASGTTFSIKAGDQYSSCASFVTARDTVSVGYLRVLLDIIGSSAATITMSHSPCVYFVFKSGNSIVVEEHLSLDYSFENSREFQNVLNSPFDYSVSSNKRKSLMSGNSEVLTFYKGGWQYDESTTRAVLATSPTFHGAFEWGDIMNAARKPISFSMWDVIKGSFGNDQITDVIWFRIMSALYLYFARPFNNLTCTPDTCADRYNPFSGVCWTSIGYSWVLTTWPQSPDLRNATVRSQVCLHDLSMYRIAGLVTDYCAKALSTYLDNGEYTSQQRDGMLKTIQHIFDGLPLQGIDWRWHQNASSGDYPNNDCVFWTRYTSNYTTSKFDYDQYYDMADFFTDNGHLWALAPLIETSLYDCDLSEYSHDGSIPTVNGLCSIDLPTATWSSVIYGLIVDGMIATAVVVTTVFALKAYMGLKKKALAARWTADTTAFNYGDGKVSFKEARTAQRKAAILEFVTGTSGAANIPESSSGDEVTIDQVYKSIVGVSA